MRRTILFNAASIFGGGQETRARQILARWRAFDATSHVILLRPSGYLEDVRVAPPFSSMEHPRRFGRLSALERMAWENLRLPGLVRSRGVDIILTFSHYIPPTLPDSVRTIVGVSNLAPFSAAALQVERDYIARLRLRLLRRSIVRSTRRADRVIALSRMCSDILLKAGVSAHSMLVLPNGVSAVDPDRGDPGILPQNGYLLSVSNFWRYKNFEVLITAIERLPPAVREQNPLVIVGYPYDRRYHLEIARQITERGLAGSIRIIPGLKPAQLASAYAGARLFIFPSLIENSPNIVLEALSAGVPLLLSRNDPMPEFGGDAAEYFDPASPDELAAQIQRLVGVPAILARMAGRSAERARLFSWHSFTEQVVALCNELKPLTEQ